jgi:hypothetical protein
VQFESVRSVAGAGLRVYGTLGLVSYFESVIKICNMSPFHWLNVLALYTENGVCSDRDVSCLIGSQLNYQRLNIYVADQGVLLLLLLLLLFSRVCSPAWAMAFSYHEVS